MSIESTRTHNVYTDRMEIAKRQTASIYLKKLADIGVLRETKVGREKLFVHPKLIGVITKSNRFREYS